MDSGRPDVVFGLVGHEWYFWLDLIGVTWIGWLPAWSGGLGDRTFQSQ